MSNKYEKILNKKGFIEIIGILFIAFVFLLIGFIFYKDVSFGTKQGIVIDKKYHSAWISYNTSYVNGSSISIPVTHPESWSIKIKKDDKELWIDISENEYNQINIGDCYQCEGEE